VREGALACRRALLASMRCCRASRGLPAKAAVALYVCLSGKAGRDGGTCGGGSCAQRHISRALSGNDATSTGV